MHTNFFQRLYQRSVAPFSVIGATDLAPINRNIPDIIIFPIFLDRVETTLSLRLERAQLAAERLEHRLHMLQTSVQVRKFTYL